MNSKVINSILHDELKPWLINFDDDRILKKIIFEVNRIPLTSIADVVQRLKILLKTFPDLYSSISNPNIEDFHVLSYTTSLPVPKTLLERFYAPLIDSEILRYYNETISNPLILNPKLDVPFQVGEKSLKGIAICVNKISNELQELKYTANTISTNDLTHFVFTYLYNSLILLYFSIQDQFEDYLTIVYNSVDEFSIYWVKDNEEIINIEKIKTPEEAESIADSYSKSFSFGFKGDISKLSSLINVLCQYENLLDEEVTKPGELIELLTTDDIFSKTYRIKLGCNTNLFVFIAEKLKVTLPKFTFANIHRSNYFYSNRNTLIRQTLLSNAKSTTPVSKEIKQKIDQIFYENDL